MAKKLNILDVLKDADAETLRAFLRKEVRRNSALAVRMKLLMIEAFDVEPSENRYRLLLEELVSIDVHGKVRLTRRKQKLLAQVADRFLEIAGDALADKEFRKCHNILIVVLQKLHQYVDKVNDPDEGLILSLKSTYRLGAELSLAEIAPELKQGIFEDHFALIQLSYYRLYDPLKNCLTILLRTYGEKDQLIELLELISQKRGESADSTLWTTWYFRVFAETELPPQEIISFDDMTTEQCLALVHLLGTLSSPEAMALAINRFYDHVDLPAVKREMWAEKALSAAIDIGVKSQIVEWGLELLSQTHDPSVVHRIRRAVDQSAGDSLRMIARQKGGLSLESCVLAGDVQWGKLLELIRTHQELEIAAEHLPGLLDYDREATLVTIREITPHYVTHHAGQPCARVIGQCASALETAGEEEFLEEWRNALNHQFPRRFTEAFSALDFS